MSAEMQNPQAGPRTTSHVAGDSLLIEWSEAPWDAALFERPVWQIDRIEIRGPTPGEDVAAFERARDELGCALVSCRLPHERLRESMLLEDRGFRFIEMLYHPELADLANLAGADAGLVVEPACSEDLPALLDIAGSAFRNERFHVDPRMPPGLGDRRYRNWVWTSLGHPTQRLHVVRDRSLLVAFFVTEQLADGTCYWHLNAVAPEVQGKGYGRRAWLAMLEYARDRGARRVRTSIVARNHRVLNLYASLGFRFPPPQMTFHWLRTS